MHTNASLDYSRLPAFDIFYSQACGRHSQTNSPYKSNTKCKKTNLFKKKAPPNFLRSLRYVQRGVTTLSR